MAKKDSLSRRQFLKGSLAAATVFTIVPRHVLGGSGYTPPSDQLTKAIIGVGAMGRGHINYGNTRLLAVCDVDERHIERVIRRAGKGVTSSKDFREILSRPDIDIVHIATPPHWHALMSIAAAEAGKDIWCEKPMTRTIGEGIKVVDAVQRNGRMFRINTWFRFDSQFYSFGTTVKPVKKLVQSGLLGWPIRVTISATTGFDWKFYWSGETNLKPQPVPDYFDYDMWLGPAPYKPYHPHRTHGTFRGYWDYDGGGLGDMGQHYLDPIQYLMGKDDTSPVEIEVDAPQQHPDAVSSWRRIWMKYEDGCEIVLDGENRDKNAPFIAGSKGNLYRGFVSDIPNIKEKLAGFPEPEEQLIDFIQSVKTRKKFALNETYAHRSCTLINLGKIALRLGRKLNFDPNKQRFVNDEEANRFINQPMRAPWYLK